MAILKGNRSESFSEEKVLQYLQRNLPDSFTIYHNLEITLPGSTFEQDAIIVGPFKVFVVEIKGTHDAIEIDLHNWHSDGEILYPSPIKKLWEHTRKLKSAFKDTAQHTSLHRLWFQPCVLLPNVLEKPKAIPNKDGREIENHLEQIVCLKDSKAFFTACKSADALLTDEGLNQVHSFLGKYIQTRKPSYRDWLVSEELTSNNSRFREYAAHHRKSTNARAKLRVYPIDQPDGAKGKMMVRLLRNQLELSLTMSGHANIVTIREAFVQEDGSQFVVVSDNVKGATLVECIRENKLATDEKLRVVKDVLSALDHAHSCGVIHRNLSPKAITIDESGRARVGNFEFGGSIGERPTTVKDLLGYLPESNYTAPEFLKGIALNEQSDLYSAGVIFYELLEGSLQFDGSEGEKLRGLKQPQLIEDSLWLWLKQLCASNCSERYRSASQALTDLSRLF